MGRGRRLTDYERGQIDTMYASGSKVYQIAQAIGRSFYVVKSYLENRETYGKSHGGGKQKALTAKDKRQIVRHASNKMTSVMEIKHDLQLAASKSTIWRAIKSSGVMEHKKLKKVPRLTEAHKKRRVTQAKDWLESGYNWTKVIFSDEKKFNLDGPDGYACYWHDLRKEEKYFSKRQQGGGSLMMWGCFGYNGGRLAVVSGRLKAPDYCELLETQFTPFAEDLGGPNWVFQQDNASIHAANYTREWFLSNQIRVLPWPACSADLNPQENVWGMLVRAVYANGRQYRNVGELREAIFRSWNQIDVTMLQELIDGVNKRLVKVVEKKGNIIGY